MSKVIRETLSRAGCEVLTHPNKFGRFLVVGTLLGVVRAVSLEDISETERCNVVPGAILTVHEYYEHTPGRRKRYYVTLSIGSSGD